MHRSLLLFCAMGLTAGSFAQTSSPVALQLEQVNTGLTRITDIAHCGDERMFLVLQAGIIRIRDGSGTLLTTPFLDISGPVNSSGGEQGLLGLAFDPDYANNGRFYVAYTAGTGNGTERLSRFTVTADPNVADPASEEILYEFADLASNHNGGDVNFGPDGYLYVGWGDGGSGGDPWNNAQNMTVPFGKILRLDVSDPDTTFTIPADNPFANATDTLPEIFASGLRNPWRWGFDRLTGDLWIGDVGQNTVEEVDHWPAGDLSGPNFGWRCYEANIAYDNSGCEPASSYVAPVTQHLLATQSWCAIIGGRVYRGPTYWRIEGRFIYTDYCGGQFYSLYPNGTGGWTRTQLLSSGQVGFSCIGENAAGELFAGNNSSNSLWKIKELCVDTLPSMSESGGVLSSTPATSYQWYLNGSPVPSATSQTYTPAVAGYYAVLATFTGGCQLASDTLWVSPVGVEETSSADITIQPIPVNDVLRIDGLKQSGAHASIIDVQGRVVTKSMVWAGSGPLTIPVRELPNGAYTVVINDVSGNVIRRSAVVVQH